MEISCKCHNFKRAEEMGRCPLVCVCSDDCVFVWKEAYKALQEQEETEPVIDIEDYNSLQKNYDELEEEKDEIQDKFDDLEFDYKNMIEELARFMTKNMRNRLYKYVTKEDTQITPEWFDKLDDEWSIRQNVNR